MRWTYLLSRILIVALVWGFIAFGVDPLLRYSSVQTLQSVTGAKADVGEVITTFFPPSVTVRGLGLASARRPGWNLVEFDEMHVKLEAASLSQRRFVVEEGRLDGLRFDTRRIDDGQLEEVPEPIDDEPSWMTEKLTELGTEWLTNLTEQVKAQLDPDTLETYRTGTEMYEKWDVRFVDMASRAKAMKPRVDRLVDQFKRAKEGDTLQQIEQYLQVSQRAEQIIIEVQGFRDELKDIVPEVRDDFQTLNAARERDQEKVKHTISLLKPDPRRISQALLGKTMYSQIQQALTWVETIRRYQEDLKEQVQPPRSAGRDFEFIVRNPGPDFLLKKLSLTGLISVNAESVPFEAMLTDVTEDPKLLGRPCVMTLAADGSRPLQLRVTYDATGDVPISEMLASYRDHNPQTLITGKREKACVAATLNDLSWTTQLTLMDDQIDGHIQLQSEIGNLSFEGADNIRPEIVEAANESFAAVRILNASVQLGGTLRDPVIDLQSDVGQQISEGVQQAFVHQLDNAKLRLISEVNNYANVQIEKLKGRFAGEYEKLKEDNKELLEQISEVQTIVASLQSGKIDRATIVRQVANSKLIHQKDQQKILNVMNEIDNTLQGRSLPAGLQEKISQLPPGFLELPAMLHSPTGFFPQATNILMESPGFLPQSTQLNTQTDTVMHQTETVMHQTDNAMQQTNKVVQQTDTFIQQTNGFLQQTQGLFQPPSEHHPSEEEGQPAAETDETMAAPAKPPASRFPQLPAGIRSLWPKPKAARR